METVGNYGYNYNNSTYHTTQAEESSSYSNTVNRNYSSRNSSQNRTSTNRTQMTLTIEDSLNNNTSRALLLLEEGIENQSYNTPTRQIQTLVDKQTQIVPETTTIAFKIK
jgi:hypothetical protein